MNLADITTKCYILALIIRDDGERLLLGDGAYEFKDSQQHFIANTYANDVVELQGTDGQMLAGQVRRTATQTFAGYIGDATFSKQKVEEARRDFLMFFRKKHYYTAVYVFSDGTAIQRKRGYIVNAPSVPELYQRFPEWSIGLNFEDPNYYEYAEDDLGHEIAAHKVELELSTAMSGGLIWDGDGAVSDDLSYVGTEIEGEGKSFQLTDTGTATLKSAELLGDATQTTYSGKNLFDISKVLSNSPSLVNNGDGTLTVKAYGTQGSGPATLADYCPSLQTGDTVTLSATTTSTNKFIYLSGTNAQWAFGASRTITATDLTSRVLWYSNNSSTTNVISDVQVELGNTATAYEPYVGGTSAPNPEFPMPVNTVTGEQTVKIEGKNLFDKSNVVVGYVNNSGTISTGGGGDRTTAGYIPVQSEAEYTISGSTFLKIAQYDSAQKFIKIDTTTSAKTLTVTTESNTSFIRASAYYGNNTPDVQLEKGTATAYEPYQGQSYEVNLGGTNLVNQSELIAGYVQNNGYPTVSQTQAEMRTDYLEVEPNTTYTFSIQATTDTYSPWFGWCEYTGQTPTTVIGTRQVINSNPATFTTSATTKYVILSARNLQNATKVQLEKRSTATPYVPFVTYAYELCKIGNYQDRIYKNAGKWYVERQVGKVVLDGSRNWSLTSGSGRYSFWVRNTQISGMLDEPHVKTCDKFIYSSSAFNVAPVPSLCENSIPTTPLTIFNTDGSQGTTTTDWRTWLASNPTTVYYALATPTTTEITNSELVGQLERLRHSHTYADTTNFSITATSPNLPAYLKVVAFGDDAIPQGGYVWEDGGTGGATIITVDGVDNAQPIWTVVGPATNPSLTNITTGESIQWTGVVPNGQTLVVNMADMTASLSGANVFEFISGSWITLQAGNNRVSYSATAATGIATLEWNGVVG